MPKNKDLKRLTRARMKKTGESYTAARAELVKKNRQGFAERAGMSDEAVKNKTGRSWQEWVRVLDARGARSMVHRDIAAYLHDEQGVPDWWAQMVTVGYERIRGLRDRGQRRSGEYEASKSKTFPIPVKELYRAFSLPGRREKWLPGVKWKVRTTIADKSIRLTWEEGTSVEITFTAKGPEKSGATIQHTKLGGKSQAAKAKAYWDGKLENLARWIRSR